MKLEVESNESEVSEEEDLVENEVLEEEYLVENGLLEEDEVVVENDELPNDGNDFIARDGEI